MKKTVWIGLLMTFLVVSCGNDNRWEVELPQESVELKYTDISKDFFDVKIPLIEIQSKYPFFFDSTTEGSVWESMRRDSLEVGVFDSVNQVFAKAAYKEELGKLFAHYKYHFPKEVIPHIFTYSSGLQNIYEPILYGRNEGMLFIALDGFLGSKSSWYGKERVYPYLSINMTPDHIASSVVQSIGREIIPFNPRQQTFIDLMIDEGKKLILADAMIPGKTDALKMGYSQEQMDWAIANEGSIWNYFVEQNLLFENDKTLRERFLQAAPFSKFLNEIEAESPGRIGVWIGWQICREYLDKNQEVSLEQFIELDTQLIFKESKYKPKKGEENYTPTAPKSSDEVKQYEK